MHALPPDISATGGPCGIAGHAVAEATLAEIPGLRDMPCPEGVATLPSRFLRHCDEQTVVGIRAVLAAIARHPEPRPSFAGHGVVGSTCRSGRIATAQSLALFRTGGDATISPHIVPQCSLHSLAGAVSVALGMHGPNIGASGGPHALSEGLFTGLSLLSAASLGGEPLPGVWLVVSGWTSEPALDHAGKAGAVSPGDRPEPPAICRAIAVALTPTVADSQPAIDFRPQPARVPARASAAGHTVAAEIQAFAAAVSAAVQGHGRMVGWSLTCPWGMEIRLAPARRPGGIGRSARPDSIRREAA